MYYRHHTSTVKSLKEGKNTNWIMLVNVTVNVSKLDDGKIFQSLLNVNILTEVSDIYSKSLDINSADTR